LLTFNFEVFEDVFQAYLNCVYFGSQTLRQHANDFKRQIKSFDVKLCVFTPRTVGQSPLSQALEEFGHIMSIEPFSAAGCTGFFHRIEFDTVASCSRAYASGAGRIVDGEELYVYKSTECEKDATAARGGLSDTGCEALIKLYLLADKLQDLITANMIMDELIRFIAQTTEIPKHAPTTLAYNSTTSSNPLCTLLRDYWVYQMPTDGIRYFEGDGFPKHFLQDVATELMSFKLGESKSEDSKRDQCSDKCQYHQHDNEHPRRGTQ
jgi:hypothetical protein